MTTEGERVPGTAFWPKVEGLLDRLGSWWLARGPWVAGSLTALFILMKDGVSFATGNVANFYLPASQALPAASGYYSSSVGNLALARLLGIETVTSWLVLHGVLVMLAIALAMALAHRSSIAPMNVALLALLAASATNVLPGSIGIYDPVTYAGAVLIALARPIWLRCLGVVIMCLGNPEQALVASICLLVLSLHPNARQWRRTAALAVGICAAAWLIAQLWIMSSGAGSRIVVLPYLLGRSFEATLANPWGVIWTWLGCGWLIVLMLIAANRGRDRWVLLTALVALPAAVTLVTVDGARVFGLVVLPAFLVAAGMCWRDLAETQRVRQVSVGAFIVLLVLLPTSSGGWGWIGELVSGPLVAGADGLYRLLTGAA